MPDVFGISGAAMIFLGLVGYTLLSYFSGHIYPTSPGFGVPCPTTIFTLGILLWTGGRHRALIMTIPLIWSVIASSAASQLEVVEDYSLLISGAVTIGLLIYHKLRNSTKQFKLT